MPHSDNIFRAYDIRGNANNDLDQSTVKKIGYVLGKRISSLGDNKIYVGGFDFEKSKFDRASSSNLLLGSSIKPFIYACAFENGINPSSVFIDGPVLLIMDYSYSLKKLF